MPIDLSAVPESVAILRRYAEPIAPALRSRFYEAVDRALVGEPGQGSYARACREVQPRFLVAPAVDLESPHRPSTQPPRSPWRRRA